MNKKKILVAVDGSRWAMDAVRYATEVGDPQRAEVVLFHVTMPVPESFYDVEKNPAFRTSRAPARAWEDAWRLMIEDFMERASQVLKRAGFEGAGVQVIIKTRQVGIARDIITEAEKGYDAVVVGRRGMSDMKDLVLGGVSTKLISRLNRVPLWLVGEKKRADGFLVALDASEEALKAVTVAAPFLAAKPRQVLLLHVIRGLDPQTEALARFLAPEDQKDWLKKVWEEMERAAGAMDEVLERAFMILEEHGVPRDLVQTRVVTGVSSRAAAIVEEAETRGSATIVMGRRGLSRVEEFFMGRVSNKVIQLAKKHTVWIVQ
ncbi:MAG: universal stress protein [Desulfosoma sp.]